MPAGGRCPLGLGGDRFGATAQGTCSCRGPVTRSGMRGALSGLRVPPVSAACVGSFCLCVLSGPGCFPPTGLGDPTRGCSSFGQTVSTRSRLVRRGRIPVLSKENSVEVRVFWCLILNFIYLFLGGRLGEHTHTSGLFPSSPIGKPPWKGSQWLCAPRAGAQMR